MPTDALPRSPDAVLMVSRIIVAALTIGLLSFAGVALATRRGGAAGESAIPAGLVLALVAGQFVAAALVPDVVARNQARGVTRDWPDSGEPSPEAYEGYRMGLAAAYQLRTILRSALFEGGGFFAAVAYLIGGPDLDLYLALALALAIAGGFPTRDRFEGWIDARLSEARLRRSLP